MIFVLPFVQLVLSLSLLLTIYKRLGDGNMLLP